MRHSPSARSKGRRNRVFRTTRSASPAGRQKSRSYVDDVHEQFQRGGKVLEGTAEVAPSMSLPAKVRMSRVCQVSSTTTRRPTYLACTHRRPRGWPNAPRPPKVPPDDFDFRRKRRDFHRIPREIRHSPRPPPRRSSCGTTGKLHRANARARCTSSVPSCTAACAGTSGIRRSGRAAGGSRVSLSSRRRRPRRTSRACPEVQGRGGSTARPREAPSDDLRWRAT